MKIYIDLDVDEAIKLLDSYQIVKIEDEPDADVPDQDEASETSVASTIHPVDENSEIPF